MGELLYFSSGYAAKTVEILNGTELAFIPGTEYSYGTVNYDVLGLVIETGQLAQGYRSSFFRISPKYFILL